MCSIVNLGKQSHRLWPLAVQQASRFSTSTTCAHSKPDGSAAVDETDPKTDPKNERIVEFRKKLRAKTPIGKLEEFAQHPFQEQEPLKPWPNSVNPHTGEIGGPAGPEPTRYGDWERKGRVSDF